MTDPIDDYPTLPVTVTMAPDGTVHSIDPLHLPVYGPHYIEWTFVNAPSADHGIVTGLPPDIFVPQPLPVDPLHVRVKMLDRCPPGLRSPMVYPYRAGLHVRKLHDPSIDNYPT